MLTCSVTIVANSLKIVLRSEIDLTMFWISFSLCSTKRELSSANIWACWCNRRSRASVNGSTSSSNSKKWADLASLALISISQSWLFRKITQCLKIQEISYVLARYSFWLFRKSEVTSCSRPDKNAIRFCVIIDSQPVKDSVLRRIAFNWLWHSENICKGNKIEIFNLQSQSKNTYY